MNDKQVRLYNVGGKCYLNSGIQAISSCPRFIKEIDKLSIDNPRLNMLHTFNTLLKSMNNGGGDYKDVSKSLIFREWNKPGQQDSFELLSHVINQIYDEIRRDKEGGQIIEARNLNQWIREKLPLRLTMQYIIKCECGYEDKCPLQSEIALHLSFPKRNVYNKSNVRNDSTMSSHSTWKSKSSEKDLYNKTEGLRIEIMMLQYFEKDNIEDFQCGNKDCKKKSAWRKLRLHSTLPDTLCIHLQRLYWTGSKMEKINDEVSFCNRIKIKEEYLKLNDNVKCENEEGIKDLGGAYYYLKSVIVHQGGESSGHYICYKKSSNDRWYYTSDTNVYEVNSERVFSCNPYILFYEKEDFEEISPTVLVNNSLNFFINAMSSCSVFTKWLKIISENNESILIKHLNYLINFVNGNVSRNKYFENKLLEQFKISNFGYDLYNTLSIFFNSIINDLNENFTKKHNNNDRNHFKFPTMVNYETTITCTCCAPIVTSSAKLIIILSYRRILEQNYLQQMADTCVLNKEDISQCNWRNKCRNAMRRVKINFPLPDMICFYLINTDKERFRGNFYFNERITMKSFRNNDGSECLREYYLKSVFCGENCFRKVNGFWYSIDTYRSERCEYECYWNGYPCIILYDRSPNKQLQVDTIQKSSTITEETSDHHYTTKSFQNPNTIKKDKSVSKPNIININVYLNTFMQAISSCVTFITHLKCIYNDLKSSHTGHGEEVLRIFEHFVYLNDVCKYRSNNKCKDDYIIEEWLRNTTNFNDVFNAVLNKIIRNYGANIWKQNPLSCPLIRRISCPCGRSEFSPPELYFCINVTNKGGHSDLQAMLDHLFRTDCNIEGKVCNDSDCKESRGTQRYKLCLPLSKTICIEVSPSSPKFTFSDRIIIRKEYVINQKDHNVSSSREELYGLISLITDLGRCCYRRIEDTWYKVTDKSSSKVSEESIFSINPHHLFYEALNLVIFDNPLRCIAHALSTCPSFVEWLKYLSENSRMIKGENLSKTITMINEGTNYNWNHYIGLDPYLLLKNVLDINEENESTNNEPRIPLIFFNICDTFCDTGSSPSIIIDVLLQNQSSPRISLQKWWDKYFVLYSNTSSYIKSLHLKCSESNSREVLTYLSNTIAFHISADLSNIIYLNKSLKLIIRNKLCSEKNNCSNHKECCEVYYLKSFIDSDNNYYEVRDGDLYLNTESNSFKVVTDLKEVTLQLVFYEV